MGGLAHNTFLNDAYREAYTGKELQEILIPEKSSAHHYHAFYGLGYVPTNTDINLRKIFQKKAY